MKKPFFILFFLMLSIFCIAEIITVDDDGPADFTCIQDAINYSWDGDIVMVSPGTYPENIYYDSRAILLTSVDPNDPNLVESTIIQGTVTFNFNEGLNSILTGFTINPIENDGVICYGSITTPLIEKNIIRGCWSGISCDFDAAPYVLSNTIENNSNGIFQCHGRIEDNIIRQNSWAGIYRCTCDVSHNIITGNGGMFAELGGIYDVTGDITDNTITGNSGIGIYSITGNIIGNTITGNSGGILSVTGNVEGNIVTDNNWGGVMQVYGDVTGNIITGNGAGIEQCQGLIYQNEISNNTGNGLNICRGTIYKNTINTNDGIGLVNCDADIQDNTISGNIGNGLEGCSGSISQNTIVGNDGGIFKCNANIANNFVSDNQSVGIFYQSSGSYIASNNTVINNGGIGVNGNGYNITIKNNLIAGNRLGGISSCNDIINNTIVENLGDGVYECPGIVKNNIIAYNQGVGIYGPSDNIYNCFWQNTGGSFYNNYAKTGDQYMNPLFAVLGSWDVDTWTRGDYTLLSEYGRWNDVTKVWVIDGQTSPCINAGDPTDNILYEPNPNGGRINMGAYGGTEYASMSDLDGPEPGNPPIIPPICVDRPSMDSNNDCKIDLIDFNEFALQWLTCGLDVQSACWN